MANPRSDDPVASRSIGLRRSEWADIDDYCKLAGITRSGFVSMACEGTLRRLQARDGEPVEHLPVVRADRAKKVTPAVQPLARREVTPIQKAAKPSKGRR